MKLLNCGIMELWNYGITQNYMKLCEFLISHSLGFFGFDD